MTNPDQLTQDLASLRIPREPARPPTASGGGSGRPGWLRPLVIGLVVVAVLGGVAYAVVGAGSGLRDRLVAPEVKLAQVSLVSPSQADVTLVATGYVVSRRKATLAPKTLGRVARLYFREGDRVKEGQIVAELEHADIEAQLSQARADVASSRARIQQVRADLADADNRAQREARLLGGGAGTAAASQDAAARVNTVKAQLAAARAEEEAITARIRIAQVQLDYAKVRAAFSGTILRKLTEVGEVVSPTPAGGVGGLYLVADLDQLEVEADVAESQLYKVLSVPDGGGSQPASAPAEIVLDAYPDRRYRGIVSEVRPTVDRSKATVTVKVRFADSTTGVLPDMGAKVSFLAKAIEANAVEQAPKRVLPSDAITQRDGQAVVLVVENNVVRAVPVKVKGPLGTGQSEILEGPTPGMQVIRAPAADLRQGMKVKPAEG